jgi:hypothetical protein
MRKIYFLCIAMVFANLAISQTTRYWVGGAGPSAWTTATNWNTVQDGSGASGAPASTDLVVVDQDATITFAASVTTSINKLTIKAGRTVTFSASAVVILGSSTAVGWPLDVEATATLNLTKSTTTSSHGVRLKLQTAAGNAPVVNGTVNCVEGGGSLLDILSSTTLTVNGTVELGTNASAHDAGNITSTGTIIFGANSTFRNKRTNSATIPSATWASTSTIDINMPGNSPFVTLAGTSPYTFGNFIYNMPLQGSATTFFSSSTITFAGNVTINSTGTSNIRFSSATTGTPITINGNLTVNGTSTMYGFNSGSAAGTFLVRGNLNVATGATYGINFATGSTPKLEVKGDIDCNGTLGGSGNTSTLLMTGTTAQNIKVNTLTAGVMAFSPTNANGVTLQSTINGMRATTLGSNTNLFLGNFNYIVPTTGIPAGNTNNHVVTNGTGVLTVNNVSTTSGATFRVGHSATNYDPVYILPTNAVNFSVNVKNGLTVPAAIPTSATSVEWDITPSGTPGATSMDFTPSILPSVLPGVAVVGHLEGGAWVEYPASFLTDTWSIANYNGTFSPFTVSSSTALPITLTNLRGELTGATNTISWTTATEINSRKFVVERSTDGTNFTTVGDVATRAINGNSNTALNYNFVDVNPTQGKAYYRLQMVDNNSTVKYSQIVTVRRGAGKLEIVDVRPNPTTGTLYFNVLGATSNLNVLVRDLSGKVVIKKGLLQNGNFNIDMGQLSGGIYMLEAIDVRNGEKAMLKVVKQ